MAGTVDPARDLRLGLLALEDGSIGPDQLVSAVRAWARSTTRPLGEILVGRGLIDATARDRLEGRVAADRDGLTGLDLTPSFAPGSSRMPGADGHGDPDGPGDRRYRVVRPHARGGLGEVYVAIDRELNRTVALKELQADRAHDPASQARFLLEAEVTGTLEHPGIVPVYGLGRHPDGRPYYAMRFIEGETLRSAIERFHADDAHGQGQGRNPSARELTFRRLLRSVIDASNAVAYAHSRGVVHRDLKPENIMLGRFGETLVVDWGIAKPATGPREDRGGPADARLSAHPWQTLPGSLVGTPQYMSPEQAAGELDRVGPSSDIYGLGAMLYCVLVGHGPFPRGDVRNVLGRAERGVFPSPRRLRRSVDPALEAICLKAMAFRPEDRHASALELAGELEAWLADVRYRSEQDLAQRQMKGSLARLYLERSRACFGGDRPDEGMLWLARSLANAPPDLEPALRTSLGGWHMAATLLERSLAHGGELHAVAFCPEGRRLLAGGSAGAARLWDVATGTPLSRPLAHTGAVRAVAFSPDGTRIATAGDDGTIRRWDALTGEPVGPPIRHAAPVVALAYSPDGSKIAAAGGAGVSFLLDAATGLAVDRPEPGAARVLAVAFAPDGSIVATSDDDGSVILRDASTGRPIGGPLAHVAAVPALAFAPDGRSLLTGCLDRSARLWDVDRRSPTVTLPHQNEACLVGFRPDGGAFATGSADGSARLRDAATGRPIGEPMAHRAGVDRLAFRSDGAIVATGCRDGIVRLWCAETALPIGPPMTSKGAVRDLAFSPDGRRLAAGGSDGHARCWKVPAPVEGAAERITCWVGVVTGLEFDEGDAIRRVDDPALWDLRRRLGDLGGPPLR